MANHLVTSRTRIICTHETGGVVSQGSRHRFVRIEGAPVLVQGDCIGVAIVGCQLPPPSVPCTETVTEDNGHSKLLRIEDSQVMLTSVTGNTNGVPPVPWRVESFGHSLVRER